jgi:sugar phosphate isomerase/epimerase
MNEPREKMKFGRQSIVISTHAAQFEAVAYKGDIETSLAKIAKWGYDGVELAIRNPDLVDADQLENALTVNGLKVPAIGTGQAWGEERLSFTNADLAIRKAAIERINNQIVFAHRFDALVIIGLIRGVTPKGQSHRQSMEHLTECLLECTEVALTHGVRMALEPLNRYETDLILTVQDGLDIIHKVDSPNLGLLLDTFHMNIEEVNIENSIHQAGERIFHFHVADSNRWYPGGGHLDFGAILKALKATGYIGWVSGEFMPVPDADTATQRGVTYIKKIFISS